MLTMLGFEAVNSLMGIAPASFMGKSAKMRMMKNAIARRKYRI
jgi:hypothetical protein